MPVSVSSSVHYPLGPHVTPHTAQTSRRVYSNSSRPFDHTRLRHKLPGRAEADNTGRAQVAINRTFDGGCREIQGGRGGERCMMGYLASRTGGGRRREAEVSTAWGGKLFIQWSGECFYRTRRVTALEPRDTQGAVRGETEGERWIQRESGDELNKVEE